MYPSIATAAKRLKLSQMVMDGELVALDEHGRPSFQALQHRGEHPGHLIVFYAFELLHLNGRDLTGNALESRRAQLQSILPEEGRIKFSQPLPGSVQSIVEAVRSAGLEGVIASVALVVRHGPAPEQWVCSRCRWTGVGGMTIQRCQ